MHSSKSSKKYVFWLQVALVGILVFMDQWTKGLALKYLSLRDIMPIFPGINLRLVFNEGAAFGMLSDASGWQRWLFISISLFMSFLLFVWLRKIEFKPGTRLEALGLCYILGGALGNLIDRIYLGVVIDFIDVYYANWHWYTFNLADSVICIGAFLVLLTSFCGQSKPKLLVES